MPATPTIPPASPTSPPELLATPTTAATATPTMPPIGPPGVNGIPPEQFLVISPGTADHVREIFALGRTLGRNPNYYSKLGDSTAMTPHMLARFDETGLNLGPYDYLQPTVDHFAGVFGEFGVATNYGLHSWSIFDPIWAPEEWCQSGETVLDCELRLNNPSILIIRLGSNDAVSPDGFNYNIRQAVQWALDNGVVPVIVTKADRFEGPDNINNVLLRQIAAEFLVPLWDFDVVAETIPGRGLDEDGIHMTYYTANDFSDPAAFQSGHAVQDLTGLMMLDAIRRIVNNEPVAPGRN